MRDYKKPFIVDEEIEIEDICTVSQGGEGIETIDDIWNNLEPEE